MTVISAIDAKIMGVSMEPCPTIISAPKPLLAPMNSDTTAPTRDNTTETLNPAKIKGNPLATFKLNKICMRPAPKT